MRAEVKPLLQAHQIRTLGGGSPFPRPGAGGNDRDIAALLQGGTKQCLGEGTATRIAGADDENVHDSRRKWATRGVNGRQRSHPRKPPASAVKSTHTSISSRPFSCVL